MAPMGIRLSPLGVAVFCLLGLGVIYHLYAGVISSRIAAFTSKRTVNLRDLLALSVEAAVQGGREVKRVREEDKLEEKTKGKTKEGASEKLTQGDLNSHRKMYYLIKNTYPYVQVNSEEHDETNNELGVWNRDIPADILKSVEGGRDVPADSITIWIDPLDATQEYTENLLKYVTTMVCVAVDGKPVIGVIHKPFTGYTAWALVGHGSNMKPRTTYNMNPPKVIVSRSHAGKVKGFIEEAFGNTTVILPAGGAGYKVLALLDPLDEDIEKADVYIHVTFIKKWDICAGNALLTALGGHMTTLKGEEIDYSGAAGNREGLLASVKVDHQDLVAKLPAWDSSDKH
ncbi:inositol monophosphatase 3 [Salvelinus fontinalis]|uniref:inositol-phosphate phosphatase n=2 Tax=Salvelinus TaxID=8033 RepID=A0A8U1C0K8_SALNM|nr:inositol monophosphatase 3 isoform X1 [Salvelinus alpinus]XP_038859778.1 inositol monophosphatase 3 [Salvelinus namaycush]XP_055723201.1 inositol monophosphatase 3 [Salvelinus fontinalis]